VAKARRTVLYFASDLHGSEKCFRKFLNAGRAYRADLLVLGGDMAGKAIQAVVAAGAGRYRCTFRGTSYEVAEGEELTGLEQLIADHGFYPYRAQPGELEQREADGTLMDLFLELMRDRLERWMRLADERLRPDSRPAYWMLGNDDPVELDAVLDGAPWGEHADGRVLELPSGHELLSLGWSNITPWQSYRELTEEDLGRRLDDLCAQLRRPETAIFNVHVPPFDTGIDEAPVLDSQLIVEQSAGQVKMAPVGSTAVRETIERVQPLLGLHGHIHEASGFRKLGRTPVINPGSDYGSGVLNGVLVNLEPDRVRSHQFVRG
jgi:Icc-related predicted phosphoesterase